jgi:hypothetical protein
MQRAGADAVAGLVAGLVAAVAELALWIGCTTEFPEILWRDVGYAAAIVLGPTVLLPPAVATSTLLVAGGVHFALSAIYGLIYGRLSHQRRWTPLHGAAFGLTLFLINMYGFTAVYPWFAADRDWITAIAHLVFGVTLALCLTRRANSP